MKIKSSLSREIRFLVLLLSILGMCGCQDNPRGRKAVSGNVQFKGSPLNYGTIEFRAAAEGSGIATGSIVRDGKFEIPAAKGLLNGTYEVRINSTEADKTPPEPGEPVAMKNAVERIPAEFNVRTTQKIVVSDDGPLRFDFEIP